MRRSSRVRFLLPFVSGLVVAMLFVSLSGGVASLAATRYEDLNLFTNVLELVRKNYVESVDQTRLIRGAVKGMLEELDPHSSYLDPEVYREMQIDTKGELAGLGIEISKSAEGFIEVIAPIEGTPAERAGIRARDQIVAICPDPRPTDWIDDCRTTKPMTLVDAVRLMRGRRGTKITIQIARDGFERPQPYTIVRDIVKIVSVDGRLLEPDYGYVRVRAFQERTARDLAEELDALRDENGSQLTGLVLDLRNNPGGLLDQAVDVADLWLREGIVVYTKGRVESQRHEFRARAEDVEPDYPLVVLVNSGSASASEIVAGALQDHDRALILGTTTFGKGSVQTIIPLEDKGGLRLTTALYYTPGDRSIQEVGIQPDVTVENAPTPTQEEAQRRRVREKDLEGHFTQEEADPESEVQAEGAPDAASSDMQLARAVEVLKSWTYFERLSASRQRAARVQTALPDMAHPDLARPDLP